MGCPRFIFENSFYLIYWGLLCSLQSLVHRYERLQHQQLMVYPN